MKLFLIGGFLGSGKTTAITQASRQLLKAQIKVAVITNDQGEQQVDSALMKSLALPAREVANGCFCCNYQQLDDHIQELMENNQPDVIFAESVGSCTDLIATIAKPLARFRPELEVVICVFADAVLLLSLMEGTSSFIEENIRYIYKKQLQEADILIINKTDLLSEEQLHTIQTVLTADYPAKIIRYQNSLNNEEIDQWLKTLHHFDPPADRQSLELDYDLYGDGEAQLAWLDMRININTKLGNAATIGNEIIQGIYQSIQGHNLTIGHLKFFRETDNWQQKVSFTMAGNDAALLPDQPTSNSLHLLINARVQTEPDFLKQLTDEVLKRVANECACKIMVEQWSAFKPGFPTPTHRIAQ